MKEISFNEIRIDKQKILDNLRYLESLHNNPVFPVVKSHAYGHGLKEMCSILQESSTPFICVNRFSEYEVVHTETDKDMLILGELPQERYKHIDVKRTALVVYTFDMLRYLIDLDRDFLVHLFINTGMNREGFQLDQLDRLIDELQGVDGVQVTGIMSHIADDDGSDQPFTLSQIENYKQAVKKLEAAIGTVKRKHMGNTAGIGTFPKDDFFTAWRSGIGMYGYSPFYGQSSDPLSGLHPALEIVSTVIRTQTIQPGERVGYGGKWTANRSTQLGLLPFGYNEGMIKFGKNDVWKVQVNGVFYPVVGKVSMNLCSFDFGNDSVTVGDKVTIIDSDKNAENSIHTVSKKLGVSAYEILIGLDPMTPRKVVV